jgi:hypothetical protein
MNRFSEFHFTALKPKEFFSNWTNYQLFENVELSRTILVWINLNQNWPRINNFFEFRTYFYRFFSTALVSHPSPESQNLLALDRKGFSLQYVFSHLFLSARYRPFQSSWRRVLFPQQFQHSTPTTPLRASVHFDRYGYGLSMKNFLLGLYRWVLYRVDIFFSIYHQSNVS